MRDQHWHPQASRAIAKPTKELEVGFDVDGLECRRELFLFVVFWHHWDFPALPWLGSLLHYEPLFHYVGWAPALCTKRSNSSVSLVPEKALNPDTGKFTYKQTQIQVSAPPTTLCVSLAKMLVLLGVHFIFQVSNKQAKSLSSKLQPLMSRLPWVIISLGGLGGTQLSGGAQGPH